ncbi:hypothetical protein DY000_02009631 [Brassica cretica]|uniref:Chromo domain-containing protein n=1 Tax=Brassica cretica TaxID=69181 RepID=A0ABQ7BV27_BRACR|nr:hypothetical protein DY000_02009631 [Brassica cretica]
MIRVIWERDGICEETWEPESQMRSFYPELFPSVEVPAEVDVNSGANSCLVGESCHIPDPSPIFYDKVCDDLAHVEKTLGFFTSSSIKIRQPLGISPHSQNTAKPCPFGERAAAGHQTSTDRRVASPERRSHRVSIPSRRFLESPTLFLLDPATIEGKETLVTLSLFFSVSFFFYIYDPRFGRKPTVVLVDLVSKDP